MKLTKRIKAEIRHNITNLNSVLFDTEDGTIYWDFSYDSGEFRSGYACNFGLIPEHTYEYDPTESFQTNLENFVTEAQEHFNI